MSEITIGGDPRQVPPFNLTKYRIAGRLMSRLSKHLSDAMLAMAKFSQHYGEINKYPVTRSSEAAKRYGFTDADFEAQPYILMPAPADDVTAFGIGASVIFEVAEHDALRLCAVILENRKDLRDAVKGGQVDDYLLVKGEELADEADPKEFVRLLVKAVEMAREQFAGEDLVGEFRRAWSPESPAGSQSPGTSSDESGPSPEDHPAAGRMPLVGTATVLGGPERSDDSSTDSPGPTGGPPTTSSPSSPSQTPSPTSS